MKNIIERLILLFLTPVLFIACSKDDEPVPLADYGSSRITVQDNYQGEDYVVYANGPIGLMQAYSRKLEDGTMLDFEILQGQFPKIMTDTEGTDWNVFGTAISGPRTGEQLRIMNTLTGYWFAIATMFPEVTLYGEGDKEPIPPRSFGINWLINPQEVFSGAAKDGIRSLDFPRFKFFRSAAKDASYIKDNELVVVFFDGEFIRVYPHKVLDWHEIVNDIPKSGEAVISYCPLTGTASIWSRIIEGSVHTFGVSGLLYNSNLILYDRQTNSNWLQMKQQAVNGHYIAKSANIIPYFEMTWTGAKRLSNELLVLSNETGTGRNYDDYPYGDYRTNQSSINFPINYIDDRVPNKERVLAVIVNGGAKVYRFTDFN